LLNYSLSGGRVIHRTMVTPFGATAGRQLRDGIRANGWSDQQKADHIQQQKCAHAVHVVIVSIVMQ
jgi:hypothetical protein